MNAVIAQYSQGALTGRNLQAAIDEAMEAIAADDAELSRLSLSKDELLTVRFEVKEEGGFIAEGILLAIAIGAGQQSSCGRDQSSLEQGPEKDQGQARRQRCRAREETGPGRWPCIRVMPGGCTPPSPSAAGYLAGLP